MELKKLNDDDLFIIKHTYRVRKKRLSIGTFYVKKSTEANGTINELLGMKIAEKMGINCAKYYAVNIDGSHYLISEDLEEQGTFKTMKSLGIYYNEGSLYEVWFNLVRKYGNSLKEVYDVVKVYMFDILFSNADRHGDNIGILFTDNNERKITILDNEYLLKYKWTCLTSEFSSSSYEIYEEFKHFLSESSSEYIDLFKYYFELFTPEYIEELINEIEQETNIKFEREQLIGQYRLHHFLLYSLLPKERGK